MQNRAFICLNKMDVVFGKLRFNYHMRENKRQTVTKNRLSGNRQTKRIYKKKKTN